MVDKEQYERIKEHNKSNPSLFINRMPRKTKDRFREIANEFCNDYGLTFKMLIDFYDGIVLNGNEQMMIEIDKLNHELEQLKEKLNQPQEEEKKQIRTGNGKVIR